MLVVFFLCASVFFSPNFLFLMFNLMSMEAFHGMVCMVGQFGSWCGCLLST